jgi:hypothetical protein
MFVNFENERKRGKHVPLVHFSVAQSPVQIFIEFFEESVDLHKKKKFGKLSSKNMKNPFAFGVMHGMIIGD